LANSKIIHYFASDLALHSSPYILASKEVIKNIKDTGVIPDKALELLKNPKSAFASEIRIVAGEDMLNVLNSNLFEYFILLRQKIPGLFNFFNRLGSVGKSIVKFFVVRISRKKDGGVKHYN